ncbi:atypical dual specificity phosphatase [uncultured bacterium]|nr:atypical dual specificity phosphatase [uncultured bacterium]
MGTEKRIWFITAAFLGLVVYGVWNLFQPDRFPMSFARGEVREAIPGVLIGPYPTEEELKVLKRNGVAEVMSLMDPESIAEAALVRSEKELVSKAGLAFVNYPMDFKDMNGARSAKGMEGALERLSKRAGAKVYVHCYLGRHRVGLVEAALKTGAPPSN